MSRKKFSESEIIFIVQRAMNVFGCKKKKDFANLFGILPQDMTARIKRGTVVKLIETEAYKRNVNFNYILTGKGNMIRGAGDEMGEPESIKEDPETAGLLSMTREILKSDTDYSASLAANIRSFHRAIETEKRLQIMESRLGVVEKRLKEIPEENIEKKVM